MNKTEYKNIGETLYSCKLDNGLEIRVVPKPGFSSFYAVFGTNYGGAMRRFEIDGKTIDTPAGVAHFLEHKMFDLPNGDNALSILSANGADPNAFTSSGVTCYYFKCTEGFEENLRMLLHFVSTPYFTPETVEKEQGIIGQEIQMVEDNPGSEIYYNLLSLLYDHHPIKDKVAGSIESIAQITDKTLYDCHKIFYSPSNMILCVEGDVDPEKIAQIAKEELSSECASVPHADFGEAETLLPVCLEKSVEMSVSAPQFFIGAKVDADAPMKDKLTANLALKLLCGASSPFYTRLYSDGTLNRDFDFEIDYSAGTGTMIIGGESQNPHLVLDELLKEIDAINNKGFDDAYFERQYKSVIGSRLRSLEDFDDVCISLVMSTFQGDDYFGSFDTVKDISRKDCENWIRNNLTKERLAISIITPVK